ncbi:MAG: (d)CMP kinase, partial [Chlamydiales bacterium]
DKNSVFEGRDMGTKVFPNAPVKIYLTARPAVRAERRYQEFKGREEQVTEEEVMRSLLERDHFDSTREIAPLKQAEDAHLIDTSDLTIDQVVDRILAIIPSTSS